MIYFHIRYVSILTLLEPHVPVTTSVGPLDTSVKLTVAPRVSSGPLAFLKRVRLKNRYKNIINVLSILQRKQLEFFFGSHIVISTKQADTCHLFTLCNRLAGFSDVFVWPFAPCTAYNWKDLFVWRKCILPFFLPESILLCHTARVKENVFQSYAMRSCPSPDFFFSQKSGTISIIDRIQFCRFVFLLFQCSCM